MGLVLAGSITLRFADEPDGLVSRPGRVARHRPARRHRGDCTDQATPTVWLAVHCDEIFLSIRHSAPDRLRCKRSRYWSRRSVEISRD
jgi:hypothetical protein